MMTITAAVTPNWRWDHSPLPTDTLTPPCSAPLEWAYLARTLDGDLSVIDAYQADLSDLDVASRVVASGAAVVVVSSVPNILYWRCPPFSIVAVARTITALRAADYDGLVIVVGPHGTHSPEWVAQSTGADVVWRGSTDAQLGPAIRNNRIAESPYAFTGPNSGQRTAVDHAVQIPEADLSVLQGLVYPPHAWSLTEAERAVMGGIGNGVLLESSRGCPWSCAYCAKGPVRDRFERREPAIVAREIETARSAGWDYAFFIDETFNIQSDQFYEVLNSLERSGMRFGFQGRPDLIDAAMAQRLADAGCVYVELGVDVAGDLLSREYGRRQHLDRAEAGIDAAINAIPVVRYNRLNTRTIDYREIFASTSDVDWEVPVDPIYPYPGAPLGDQFMRKNGLATFDWPLAEQYSWWLRMEVALQRTEPNLTDEEIRQLQTDFMALTREEATDVATAMSGIETFEGLHTLNKSIGGLGGGLHLRHTGA